MSMRFSPPEIILSLFFKNPGLAVPGNKDPNNGRKKKGEKFLKSCEVEWFCMYGEWRWNYEVYRKVKYDVVCRAKHVWEELKETYDKVDGSIMFGLHNQINTLKQNGSSIADYYHKLSALWKQYDAMIELPKCVCNASEGFKKHNQLLKLMQFLMGLDDSYMQIRSSIMSKETLPDVRSAYATISSEESHRVAVGSIVDQVGGSGLMCENYGFNGHTIDRCFKIIGCPADFEKKKSSQNFKKQGVSNKNSVGKSPSSGFMDEQMATLISFIKDNKVGKMCRLPSSVLNGKSPYEMIYKKYPTLSHLRVFGCLCFATIVNNNDKFSSRVVNDLNKGKSDSSSSSKSGSNINTADFLVDSGNDADSSNDFVATQNEEVATLEENIFSKGFGQKKGIDYEETFSPVVKMITVRCLLNIVVSMSWPVFQLDVNNLSKYGDLEEVVYKKPPEGYFPSDNKGCIYALLVLCDDIIITDNSVSEIKKFKVFLKSKFMIKDLGKLKYFFGIEVVDTDKASDKDPLLENNIDYQKLMGKLIYLTNTRPDISYVVHCLSQFMHYPLTSHLKIAFKVLRYLKSCPGLGVHITKTSGMFLTAYSDVDWTKCIVTRKFVTVYCVFLNSSLVSCKSKKQDTLSKSSTEAEYRALASVTSEVIWILKTLKRFANRKSFACFTLL
ncbi:ribonuclease H-like domain-containing protein [Tanacetum coccineum]